MHYFRIMNEYHPAPKTQLQRGVEMVESLARKILSASEIDLIADLLESGFTPLEVAEDLSYVRKQPKPNRNSSHHARH